MKTRAELKGLAKEQIRGKIGVLFVITLIVGLLSGLCSAIPVGSIVSLIVVTPALSISLIRVYLGLAKGVKPAVSDTFAGFDDFFTGFKVTALTGIFTFLWSLLFVIPGIIKSFAYSQAMYIVAENPGISSTEAIKKSEKMMEGHKMDYFVLVLSFYGWMLLGALTCGLLYIWLLPYMTMTMTNFYNNVKELYEAKNVVE